MFCTNMLVIILKLSVHLNSFPHLDFNHQKACLIFLPCQSLGHRALSVSVKLDYFFFLVRCHYTYPFFPSFSWFHYFHHGTGTPNLSPEYCHSWPLFLLAGLSSSPSSSGLSSLVLTNKNIYKRCLIVKNGFHTL